MSVVYVEAYDPSEYPHGCRCACCNELFKEGDIVHGRALDEMWAAPVCDDCQQVDADLAPDHPFRNGRRFTLLVDGTVERRHDR